MTGLVYAGEEVKEVIRQRWPEAEFSDARDMVHQERFEVTVPDVSKDEFYAWAIRDGWALAELGFGLMMRTQPERVRRWLDMAEELE